MAIAKYLPWDEFDLTICALRKQGLDQAGPVLEAMGVRAFTARFRPTISTPSGFAATFRGQRLIARHGPFDIQHSLDWTSSPLEALLALAAGRRYLYNQGNLNQNSRQGLLKLKTLLSNHIIAISEATRDILLRQGVRPGKVTKVYLGLDTESVGQDGTRSREGLLSVGQIIPLKRHEDAIHVLATLSPSFPELRLRIAGPVFDERYHQALRRLASDLGVSRRVDFLGVRDDVLQLMAGAQVLLHCADLEAFGWVILEAWSVGLPVVASQSNGPKEVVTHGQTGFLAPVGDISAYSDAVRVLLTSPGLADAIAAKARESLEEKYSARAMVDGIAEVYRCVAGRGQSGRASAEALPRPFPLHNSTEASCQVPRVMVGEANRSVILMSSEFPPGPGGIGTHAHQLSLGLVERGWKVTVLAPQDYAADWEVDAFNAAQPFDIIRLRRHSLKPLAAVYRYRELTQVVHSTRPDLLLATGDRSTWVVSRAAARFGLPWVAVGHGTEFNLPTRWERLLTRRAFEGASAVICVSEFTRSLMERAGIRCRHVYTVPNGADAGRFRVLPAAEVAKFRTDLGFDAEHLLLTVGNVTERKGQEVVIRALPRVLERFPRTHYLVAGLPTKRPEYEALASDLGITRHVHYLGRVGADELVRLLNACDLFVMTSRTTSTGDCEGYGIAVVEAALCGKPAVVSQGSGLSEAIVDGTTGVAVTQDDPVATADAITSLLFDEKDRTTMGQAALERARTELTWDQRVGQYDAVLRQNCRLGAALAAT
jgi:phosphatidylinositol alpha-1,6-mannosyltransferase